MPDPSFPSTHNVLKIDGPESSAQEDDRNLTWRERNARRARMYASSAKSNFSLSTLASSLSKVASSDASTPHSEDDSQQDLQYEEDESFDYYGPPEVRIDDDDEPLSFPTGGTDDQPDIDPGYQNGPFHHTATAYKTNISEQNCQVEHEEDVTTKDLKKGWYDFWTGPNYEPGSEEFDELLDLLEEFRPPTIVLKLEEILEISSKDLGWLIQIFTKCRIDATIDCQVLREMKYNAMKMPSVSRLACQALDDALKARGSKNFSPIAPPNAFSMADRVIIRENTEAFATGRHAAAFHGTGPKPNESESDFSYGTHADLRRLFRMHWCDRIGAAGCKESVESPSPSEVSPQVDWLSIKAAQETNADGLGRNNQDV